MSEAAAGVDLERIREVVREEVRAALADLGAGIETVDVAGAAAILHTSKAAIYARYRRDQMPTPLPGKRRLVWRKVDLLRLGT